MTIGRQQVFSAAPANRKADDVAALFARATEHCLAGRLAEAAAGYKKILKKRPSHFDALHMLGVTEHQSGNPQAAERLLRRALLLDPQSVAARYALAIVLVAQQRRDEALTCFDNLIASKPDLVDAHFQRGNVLLGLRRFAEAIASYDTAIAIDPQHADALINKGNALHELGRFSDAITCYDRVLTEKPAHVLALVNRGSAFKDLQQAEKAIAEFDLALAIAPDYAIGWINRGEAQLVLARLDDALASFDRAISIDPGFVEAWLGRSKVLMAARKVTDAVAACQRALAIMPGSAEAITQLGQCLGVQGDAEAAVSCFDRALAIKPNYEFALLDKIFYLDFCAHGDFAEHQTARSEWWRRIGANIAAERRSQHDNVCDPDRRIVLGYVSAEFRRHSAAYSVRPVLESHDKSRFEVICYSASPTEDAVTASFRNSADRWRNVSQWSDEQLAECVRADKVDILVDLSGHAAPACMRAFARKPAPIQVTAWGHATGTGLPTIDYLFSDPVLVPSAVRHLFAEQIYDLPCAIILEPPPAEFRRAEPPVTSNGYLTYGLFNRVSKFSDAAIAVWGRILRADATSRLLVKDQLIDDVSVRAMLLEKFAGVGIAPDRISLLGATSREDHLAAYRHVDVCLDPFPHGGGVSTWETLHMGVPVVTKLGNAVPKRAAGAILSAIGMADWVAADDDQYVDIASRATADHLRTLRHELPDLISRRCGPAAYTKAVEAAYRAIWEKHCAERRVSEPPQGPAAMPMPGKAISG
jgi:predicted O-linked N-acetylglucosamine transferase (SPINDLY family)